MTIELLGADQLIKNIAAMTAEIKRRNMSALITGGKMVEAEAKQLIAAPSIGDWVTRYRNGGNSYEHFASKAGEPPNTDTGTLIKSIQTEITHNAVYVGTNNEYAPHLEFGTVKMAARPFLNPAYQNKKKEVFKLINKATNETVLNFRRLF